MPHKRTRACAQIDETQNKLHCEEAKARYESIFKNQQMHPEKGFTLKESKYKDFMAHIHIRQVVEALNWELFCEKRPSVDEELIHEFYATLTSSDLTEVPVHGIKRVEESEDPGEEDEDPTGIEPIQSAEVPNKVEPIEPKIELDDKTSIFRAQPPSLNLRDELSKLKDIMHHMEWQQQAYWRYSKIRDDSMRCALKNIYNDPFISLPEFPNFIFEPWSPLSKRK
ncbi:hypothetical protein PVK06_035446 [Gossypium arboreum]|uniref:Uncharacterized protein n=1 Tax=Gossypium arboreum TaxID=29729 RepID=A0ABR0NGU2_GOSAR|nr:hypothetical protein PVK06_035446 [Gossypium arboreum]